MSKSRKGSRDRRRSLNQICSGKGTDSRHNEDNYTSQDCQDFSSSHKHRRKKSRPWRIKQKQVIDVCSLQQVIFSGVRRCYVALFQGVDERLNNTDGILVCQPMSSHGQPDQAQSRRNFIEASPKTFRALTTSLRDLVAQCRHTHVCLDHELRHL